jgi:hypothetical protein
MKPAVASEVTPETIQAQLERILSGRTFQGASRLAAFLRFIVEEALHGRSDQIKEFTIAAEVYGKGSDFDSRTDSTVRADASKLRTRLSRYYAEEGVHDPIMISVPRGAYVPEFSSLIKLESPPAGRVSPRNIVMAAVVVATLIASGALFWPSSKPNVELTILPVTTFNGSEGYPSLSPDASQVTFHWDGESQDNFDIYVKSVEGAAIRRLTATPASDKYPAWSPDGTAIAFTRDVKQLLVISPLGGPERSIPVNLGVVAVPSWTPDSRSLLLVARESFSHPFAIYRIHLSSGELTKLTQPPGGLGDLCAKATPAGDKFVFARAITPGLTHLYSAPLQRSPEPHNPVPLLRGTGWINGYDFTPSGKHLIISSNHTGTRGLWRMPVGTIDQKELEPVPGVGATAYFPSISRTGRMVFAQAREDTDLF